MRRDFLFQLAIHVVSESTDISSCAMEKILLPDLDQSKLNSMLNVTSNYQTTREGDKIKANKSFTQMILFITCTITVSIQVTCRLPL